MDQKKAGVLLSYGQTVLSTLISLVYTPVMLRLLGQSEYGLYIKTVNGITLDWDKDAMYWAFYIDGEYAMTGVDTTKAEAGAIYMLKPEG